MIFETVRGIAISISVCKVVGQKNTLISIARSARDHFEFNFFFVLFQKRSTKSIRIEQQQQQQSSGEGTLCVLWRKRNSQHTKHFCIITVCVKLVEKRKLEQLTALRETRTQPKWHNISLDQKKRKRKKENIYIHIYVREILSVTNPIIVHA